LIREESKQQIGEFIAFTIDESTCRFNYEKVVWQAVREARTCAAIRNECRRTPFDTMPGSGLFPGGLTVCCQI
jgi:hypothetical protein